MSITRCKFYVSSVTVEAHHGFENEEEGRTWSKVNLNASYSPDPETENNSFWKYTPSGSMSLSVKYGQPCEFKPGQFWYIDTEADSSGKYILTKLNKESEDYLSVELKAQSGTEYDWVTFGFTVSNPNVFPMFTNLGAKYKVTLYPAKKK